MRCAILLAFLATAAVADPPLLLKAVGKGAEALLETEHGFWPSYQLKAEQSWRLNAPKGPRFDASALLLLTNGDLLTLSDRGPTLYRIEFRTNSDSADLITISNVFTSSQLRKYAREKFSYY